MSTQLILTLLLTVVLTALIVWGARWVKKNKEKHPEIYKNRGILAGAVWLLLNSGDLK